MAVNDLATTMILFQALILCLLGASATALHTRYEIANSNEHALTSDSRLTVSFASGSLHRFRRQSDDSSGNGGVNADTPTNNGPGSQTLPDASSQPVESDSNTTQTSPATTTTKPTPVPATNTPGTTTVEPDIKHDFHSYYTSDVIRNKFDQFWVELENVPRHETLSTSHRVAAVIPLKFPFQFYGHRVTNVTVATGGFIYMSPFLHQWLTATQYIAPLMANFDPSMYSDSNIYYQSTEQRFTVEWKNVVLKDQNDSKFHFQAILQNDNSIVFVYKNIPYDVGRISTDEHPVKVGVSDAYYNDTDVPEFKIKRRTIYEYHKVTVPKSSVRTGSVIMLKPEPTCNVLNNCDTCVKHVGVQFDCRWCNTIGRCSDGLDWYRQHWDREDCQRSSVSTVQACPTASLVTTGRPMSSVTPPFSSTVSTSTRLTTTRPALSTPYPISPIIPTQSPTPIPTGGVSNVPITTPQGQFETTSSDRLAVNAQANKIKCDSTNESDQCSLHSTSVRPQTTSLNPNPKTECNGGKCDKKSKFPVAVVVVVILIVVGLLIALGGWVYYAYTHPTSKSGMWLMEHRPSQIKAKIKFWKSSTDAGAKYKADSEA